MWRNGRRAGFRCLCPSGRGGSSPLIRISPDPQRRRSNRRCDARRRGSAGVPAQSTRNAPANIAHESARARRPEGIRRPRGTHAGIVAARTTSSVRPTPERCFARWLSHKGPRRVRGGNRCAASGSSGGRRPSQGRNRALWMGLSQRRSFVRQPPREATLSEPIVTVPGDWTAAARAGRRRSLSSCRVEERAR